MYWNIQENSGINNENDRWLILGTSAKQVFEEHEERRHCRVQRDSIRSAETKEPISSQSEGWLDTGTSWFRGRLPRVYIKLNHTSSRYSHRFDAIIQYFEANLSSTNVRPMCAHGFAGKTCRRDIFQIVAALIKDQVEFSFKPVRDTVDLSRKSSG